MLVGWPTGVRPWAGKILELLYLMAKRRQPRSPEALLFPHLSLSDYETCFRTSQQDLDIASPAITPHVVRHSAPTHDRLHGIRTLAQIQRRGRWASLASVRRYEKPARVLKSAAKLSPAQQVAAKSAEASFPMKVISALSIAFKRLA